MAKQLRILIVEDEPLLVMDIEMMVEDAGHTVVGEAASLFEVADMQDAVHPDLAFVDMHLARNTNGLDVSKLIQSRWKNAIIIFVTANTKMIPEDFAGAHGAIPKPFSRNGFLSALRYLSEGITRPPPVSGKPGEFRVAKFLSDRWAATA
jgi:AmiR/NasT family two-component response regulator